jgi:hypothetical protein
VKSIIINNEAMKWRSVMKMKAKIMAKSIMAQWHNVSSVIIFNRNGENENVAYQWRSMAAGENAKKQKRKRKHVNNLSIMKENGISENGEMKESMKMAIAAKGIERRRKRK